MKIEIMRGWRLSMPPFFLGAGSARCVSRVFPVLKLGYSSSFFILSTEMHGANPEQSFLQTAKTMPDASKGGAPFLF